MGTIVSNSLEEKRKIGLFTLYLPCVALDMFDKCPNEKTEAFSAFNKE
jgi:hypothetical protein